MADKIVAYKTVSGYLTNWCEALAPGADETCKPCNGRCDGRRLKADSVLPGDNGLTGSAPLLAQGAS